MVLRLILKDLMAYRKTIIVYFLGVIILGNIFIFRYYPWHVYMMYGYLALAFISTYYSFSEKNRNTEVLTCSLPVTRSSIVKARYLVSAILTIGGLLLWIGNAYVAGLLHADARTVFDHVAHMKVLFMALFFISIYSSIFLPSVFSFRLMGTVITFIIALVTAVASVPLVFHPYGGSYNPYFEYRDLMSVSVLFIILVGAPSISFIMSLRIYNSKDI
jgi:hypothetical protein